MNTVTSLANPTTRASNPHDRARLSSNIEPAADDEHGREATVERAAGRRHRAEPAERVGHPLQHVEAKRDADVGEPQPGYAARVLRIDVLAALEERTAELAAQREVGAERVLVDDRRREAEVRRDRRRLLASGRFARLGERRVAEAQRQGTIVAIGASRRRETDHGQQGERSRGPSHQTPELCYIAVRRGRQDR